MTTSSSTDRRGAVVRVLYVDRQNAKTIKTLLEEHDILNKDFRMTAVDMATCKVDNVSVEDIEKCIAIPVLKSDFLSSMEQDYQHMVIATGMQFCPFSSAMLGNHRRLAPHTGQSNQKLTHIQLALLEALLVNSVDKEEIRDKLVISITKLNVVTCPKKLELLGDDKTLIISQRAFSLEDPDFYELLKKSCGVAADNMLKDDTLWTAPIMTQIWKRLALINGSPRVARRGDIDPESKIRHSGHFLLWPHSGFPESTGPGSPGWITVTENGIQQSFDLTRVMFSRGNVTEKMRLGTLVQPGEMVLDLYAGIGYYTLPALKHGKAKHVYACEWNPDAIHALRYNLQQNDLHKRATVLQGDCRVVAVEHDLVDKFDRVSLGLLPSSEGGWKTAVRALRHDKGGWLHVHANVPDAELRLWRLWMCRSLYSHCKESWIVLNTDVERVKSFAPLIHHYVADVFVGPRQACSTEMEEHHAGIIENGVFVACPSDVQAPSCALSSMGVLYQKWMMDTEDDS